jgi:hypothetical protein
MPLVRDGGEIPLPVFHSNLITSGCWVVAMRTGRVIMVPGTGALEHVSLRIGST